MEGYESCGLVKIILRQPLLLIFAKCCWKRLNRANRASKFIEKPLYVYQVYGHIVFIPIGSVLLWKRMQNLRGRHPFGRTRPVWPPSIRYSERIESITARSDRHFKEESISQGIYRSIAFHIHRLKGSLNSQNLQPWKFHKLHRKLFYEN